MTHMTARDAGITKFYVVYHEPKVLNDCLAPPDATKLLLGTLDIPDVFQDNQFAESRFLLYAALQTDTVVPATGYMALFHASFNTKFGVLPDLAQIPGAISHGLDPSTIIAPVACRDYATQADRWHPGLKAALTSVAKKVGLMVRSDRIAPLVNTFVAHVDVWRRFLPVWLRAFLYAIDEDPTWACNEWCKPGLAPAYLLERLTTLWFSNQEDLTTRILVNDGDNRVYYAKSDLDFEGVMLPNSEVLTVNPPR